MIAENGKPITTQLSRCIDGRAGAQLLAGQQHLRAELADRHSAALTAEARAAAALVEARHRGIAAEPDPTGGRESAKPAVGAVFPDSGPVGGVGVPGT